MTSLKCAGLADEDRITARESGQTIKVTVRAWMASAVDRLAEGADALGDAGRMAGAAGDLGKAGDGAADASGG